LEKRLGVKPTKGNGFVNEYQTKEMMAPPSTLIRYAKAKASYGRPSKGRFSIMLRID
jgi:hypothetical protein